MRDFIKKYEVWVFLVQAPIVNTVITYFNSKGLISDNVYGHGRFFVLLFTLICLVAFTRGIQGVKELFKPMLVWKINPKWYIFSFTFALTMCLVTLFLKSRYYGIEYSSLLELDLPPIKFAIFILGWAFMGEVVWVSYAIRQLSKKLNPFYASQIIGFFWTCWWLPSVFINVGVINDLPPWPLLLNMLGVAGMCAIVYGKTKSGLCVWILQFMLNLSMLILSVSPTSGGIPTYTTFAILYFLTMLGFMYFINPAKKTQSIGVV